MKSFKIITTILLLFLSFSCQNDDDNSLSNNNPNNDTDAFTENFGNEITRTFLGKVIDKNNNPIENVTITIGSTVAQTDNNGIFIISDATVYERFGYVKAEKAGYIHGSRAVVPSTGTNKVTIMLLEETVTGTTNSGTTETISLPNGASVALEGEYIKADGSSYSGSINIIMHFLDPTDENMINQMPGMLYAANANNEERMLQTFGMLAVELRGSGGEDLNLAEGSSAEISVPVDASLLASAPATIPLWYFDEDAGYWKEEGFATLVGNAYVGIVSHFSFWNCDIPAEAINLCIAVTDDNGNPLTNLWVEITSTNYGTRGGYTNGNGEVCGLVPSNENLSIGIRPLAIESSCVIENLHSSSLGSLSEDSSITIEISESGNYIFETISGLFVSCDGEPISQGYVNINYLGVESSSFVDNGNFEINLIRCDEFDTFHLQAYDYVNVQQTDSISYTFTTPITNIGTIAACDDITDFIQYTIDDGLENLLITNFIETTTIIDPVTTVLLLSIYGGQANICFYLGGQITEPYEGTYNYFNDEMPNDTGFSLQECFDMSPINNNVIFNLTSFGEIGEYIDINFSGDYEDYSGNPHTINGIIHVLRDQ